MKNIKKYFLILALITTAISGCKKDDEQPTPTPSTPYFNINLKFEVDSVPLVFNQLEYYNAAGNHYSVATLKFYLSQICLVRSDSQKVLLKDYMYIDAATPPVLSIPVTSIASGNYVAMSFNIGLDSAHNIAGGLPATFENLAMEWPAAMGGGYHFMKLEGTFEDTSGTPGYAMHLGNNMSLCPVMLSYNVGIASAPVNMTLAMNINEWYKDPSIYNFNVDGNYSMGNMMAMSKLSANGYNVFSIR